MVNALAAGNTVVLKPSPKTPLIAEKLVALFQEAGFPSGSVGLVQGDRDEAKELILSDVRRIVFTGSVPGGRAIMGLAAQKLHPLTLELGGKHAAIVRADINIQDCVSSFAWCGFTNNGQACASIERMYVHRSVADKLIPAIVAEVKKLRLGNGLDANVDLGPVIDEGEMKRVKSQIEDAVAKGAKLLTGGNIREDLGGFFLEPTVLADVTPDMRVIKEECFGPILPIMTVDSDQDAIAHTNNCHLGLGTSIWTKDLKKGEELAKDIEAGMVWINDGLTSHINPDAPWGGIKDSGFGRTHSAQGLLDLTYCKYVSLESAGKRDWHFPYNATRLELMKNSLSMIHGKNIFSKLIAAIKALPGLISVRTNKG
jgi:succinate-semialdehyde dehydrogenase/glutarate-semialdehyde dehydrogenase